MDSLKPNETGKPKVSIVANNTWNNRLVFLRLAFTLARKVELACDDWFDFTFNGISIFTKSGQGSGVLALQAPSDSLRQPKSDVGGAPQTKTDEEIASKCADDIFLMFGGILHRVVERIETGLTDGIADECAAVKFDYVKGPILSAIREARQQTSGK